MGILMKNGIPYASGSEIPQGGTQGQVLKKASNLDGDFEWGNGGSGGGNANFDIGTVPLGGSGAYEVNAILSNSDSESAQALYSRSAEGNVPDWFSLNVTSGLGTDTFHIATKEYADTKQDALVSGTNIKTLENVDLLGSGAINMKTVNNVALIGSGNITTAKILYDDEYKSAVIQDTGSGVDVQIVKVDNNTLNINETAPDSRGQTQTVYNMNIPTKGYVDTELAGKQDAITGGTTGQVMMKKSDTDGDIEWRTLVGSAWGVAKVGSCVAPNSGFVVDLSDTSITSANDYEVLAMGIDVDLVAFRVAKRNTEFTIYSNSNNPLSYTVIAKGYGAANAGNVPNGGTTGQALIKQSNTDGDFVWEDTGVGDLTALTTTAQTDLVSAVNEVKFGLDNLGEPFRVKQWMSNTLNVEIPYCTEDIGNTSIPKMVFTIDDTEGAEYQIVGMLSYELFDAASGGNRINAWPVCQFTGNGQKELGVRWMCGGTTRKTAKRISAWVLLKHR